MHLSPEQRTQAAAELKRFGADLQLTDEQRTKLHDFLAEARAKVAEYHETHPTATRADIIKEVQANRDQLRGRLTNFLKPEQLQKWDAEVSKAKEFLGEHMAS